MNKVYICGLVASAKGVLRTLLDGHDNVINYPFDIGSNLLDDAFEKYCKNPKITAMISKTISTVS